MRFIPVLPLGAASVALACGTRDQPGYGLDARGDAEACAGCAADSDCGPGSVCARFGGGAYCAPTCTAQAACSADRACTTTPSTTGSPTSVCVPRGGVCGAPPALGRDGGGTVSLGASPGVNGAVGKTGGSVSRLYFFVVGDTRPASVDDTSGYPVAVIRRIFEDVQSLDPVPLFGVSTGDYMFASTRGGQAGPQLDLYLYARSAYSGVTFPAMGNHECTGATASNCGPFNVDGTTDNYAQFLAKLLGPLGLSLPYYSVRIDSTGGQWTAKFVFVAANAWDGAQARWLDGTLAQPTTYTFVVRHEPASATTAPGVGPAEQIMSNHPLTLSIVGHSHTVARSGAQEIIIGNGGAPLTSSTANYGFCLVQQRADGAIQVDAIDYATVQRDATFTFAVRPDGGPAP